jgi:adenylosuccinate synthase
MKDIKVVIGSSFGDESKGHMVDYFAHQYGPDALVIRFNSGAQAGHTVTTPEGTRHVFSHFGSGTLVDSPTYLSSYFVCHPYEFSKELVELQEKGISSPKVYVSPSCMVTTPFDVMINHFIEKYRETKGQLVHGSVGVGFNETIQRCNNTGNYRLLVSDLWNKDFIISICKRIIAEYMPMRFEELTGVALDLDSEMMENAIEPFLEYCYTFRNNIEPAINIEDDYEHLIFEGAQGLGLDQDYGIARGYFPHVTHSNTGLKNVASILNELGYPDYNAEVIYVTRPYVTRHGNGPLAHDLGEKPPWDSIIDKTNVPNDYQGIIRYAWMDKDELANRIHYDWQYATENMRFNLAITCCDQVPLEIPYIESGERHVTDDPVDAVLNSSLNPEKIDALPEKIYVAFGPTRKEVEED